MTALRGSDLRAVVDQLGRPPRTGFEVIARCPGGHPLVTRNDPVDAGGDPFPTRYWLTCPDAVKAVSRLEADGWIKRLSLRADEEAAFGEGLLAAHREAAAERGRAHPGAEAWGGVAGTRRGLKCLHAHYANHLAGGEDPVGAWVAGRVEPVHREAPGRVAAIDAGTNSIRLLVAEPAGAEVARDMRITRLGAGVDRAGRFDDAALARTIEELWRYARRARALGATRIRTGATSATRDAANREAFLTAVREATGAEAEVLTGEDEARLSFLGATDGLGSPAPFLVLDIGGGSTELALGDRTVGAAISMQLGSVRATERVGPEDPPTPEDLGLLDAVVAEALAPALAAIPVGAAAALVGVAGTTTTVQALALGLERYDPDAIHRSTVRLADVERVAADLARMTVAERRALPVMAPGREDVIVAGTRILLGVMRAYGFDEALVSEADILDGLVVDTIGPESLG